MFKLNIRLKCLYVIWKSPGDCKHVWTDALLCGYLYYVQCMVFSWGTGEFAIFALVMGHFCFLGCFPDDMYPLVIIPWKFPFVSQNIVVRNVIFQWFVAQLASPFIQDELFNLYRQVTIKFTYVVDTGTKYFTWKIAVRADILSCGRLANLLTNNQSYFV